MSVLELTKPALPLTPSFLLDDDGKILNENVHVEIAKDDVFVLFQSGLENLVQYFGSILDLSSARTIFYYQDFVVLLKLP